MAHIVKCLVCEEKFDRDKIPAIKMNGRRYAHATCAGDDYTPSAEEQDISDLHKYLKQIFQDDYNYVVLNRQIESMLRENSRFTYSGILKTLVYWFTIKGNSVEKAQGRIGIVPYVYKEARDYYYALWLAEQVNADKKIEDYTQPKKTVVRIKRPERDTSQFRLFNLDD